MSLAVTVGVPSNFEAGNTVKFSEALQLFPASVWSMQFVLSRAGQSPVAIAAETDGDNFLVTLSAEQSAAIAAGVWNWAEYVSAGAERATANSGTITVGQNLAVTAPVTVAAAMLAGLESAILKLTSGTDKSVNFNGQQFEKKDLNELLKSRTLLKAEVYRETAHGGAGRVGIEFVSPYNQYPPYAYPGMTP